MSTQHTPGPWIADKLQDRDTFNIFVGGFVTAMCQVTCMENSTRRVTGNEVAANARLIAAAPELLEALKQARSEIWRLLDVKGIDPKQARHWPEIVSADAAIAKATGAPTVQRLNADDTEGGAA